MTTIDPTSRTHDARATEPHTAKVRSFAETKAGPKTTEFMLTVVFVVAVVVAAYLSGNDSLSRDDGWRYGAFVMAGYLLSRGLAKLGTHQPVTDEIDLR